MKGSRDGGRKREGVAGRSYGAKEVSNRGRSFSDPFGWRVHVLCELLQVLGGKETPSYVLDILYLSTEHSAIAVARRGERSAGRERLDISPILELRAAKIQGRSNLSFRRASVASENLKI